MDADNRAEGAFAPGDDEDGAGLAEILPQYFSLCRRDLLNLQAALEQKDFERVRVLGHNLKGSGGAYGFPELTEIGSSLETSGKINDVSAAKAGVERLAEFLNLNKKYIH
jgi:HPt (histidine-containing phosphotransfer) domain-containing protein